MRDGLVNAVVTLIALLVGAIAVEVAVRLSSGVEIWRWEDIRRTENASAGMYDPELGWTMRPNNLGEGALSVNTIAYGIRKNKGADVEETVPDGAILAVGDSFTAGSEVGDTESWPAYLEKMTGRRVLNAGVGGYGVDQAVLRAEALIPEVNPSAVLVGALVPDDILRTGYSRYGQPKPYFVKEDGAFVRRNGPPVPRGDGRSGGGLLSGLRGWLAHLHSANMVLGRTVPDWWFARGDVATGGHSYEKIANNPIDVSCHMLDRLGETLDDAAIRKLVVVQHGGQRYDRKEPRTVEAESFIRCAMREGYVVVDEYEAVMRITEDSVERLKSLYVMQPDGAYGHMSAAGNKLVADQIDRALRDYEARLDRQTARLDAAAADDQRGAGRNLLMGLKPGLSSVEMTVDGMETPAMAPRFAFNATSENSEHYAVWSWREPHGGAGGTRPLTASVHVRADQAAIVRLQLLDRSSKGAIADYRFDTGQYTLSRLDASGVRFSAEPAGDDWVRLSLSGELPGGSGNMILQLLDEAGNARFAGETVSLSAGAPMVARGSRPSAFCHPLICGPVAEGREPTFATRVPVGTPGLVQVRLERASERNAFATLAATADGGEHYASYGWMAPDGGADGWMTARLELDPKETTGGIRLQLLGGGGGAILSFVPSTGMFEFQPLGDPKTAPTARLVEATDGTVALEIGAAIDSASGAVIVQLLDSSGASGFAEPSVEGRFAEPEVHLHDES